MSFFSKKLWDIIQMHLNYLSWSWFYVVCTYEDHSSLYHLFPTSLGFIWLLGSIVPALSDCISIISEPFLVECGWLGRSERRVRNSIWSEPLHLTAHDVGMRDWIRKPVTEKLYRGFGILDGVLRILDGVLGILVGVFGIWDNFILLHMTWECGIE